MIFLWIFSLAFSFFLSTIISECPRGTFQPVHTTRDEECQSCPRGTFGMNIGLTTSECSGKCPIGTYNDRLGAISPDEDCLKCPPGTFGDRKGMTSRKCSGYCPKGTYSSEWGLNSSRGCLKCEHGYHGWQCDVRR